MAVVEDDIPTSVHQMNMICCWYSSCKQCVIKEEDQDDIPYCSENCGHKKPRGTMVHITIDGVPNIIVDDAGITWYKNIKNVPGITKPKNIFHIKPIIGDDGTIRLVYVSTGEVLQEYFPGDVGYECVAKALIEKVLE